MDLITFSNERISKIIKMTQCLYHIGMNSFDFRLYKIVHHLVMMVLGVFANFVGSNSGGTSFDLSHGNVRVLN